MAGSCLVAPTVLNPICFETVVRSQAESSLLLFTNIKEGLIGSYRPITAGRGHLRPY